MTTIAEDTIFQYNIGRVKHTITVQKGSSLLLDEQGVPIVNQSHMKKMNALFKSWIQFADQYDITWVCQGGTLLGAARESHGHLYWDDDVDVNVLYSEYNKLYDLQGVHGEYKLEAADSGFNYHHKDGGYPFIDVWVLARRESITENSDGNAQQSKQYICAGPFIDKQPTFFLNTFWPREYMYKKEFVKREKVKFEDYEAYVPANYIEVVKRQFCRDILTNYYYDKTKEAHAQMVNNWIFNNVFSLKNRIRIEHAIVKSFNFNMSKCIYNMIVWNTLFPDNEKVLDRVVDDFVGKNAYLKPITMKSIRLANFMTYPIFHC